MSHPKRNAEMSIFRGGTQREPYGTITFAGLFAEVRDGAHRDAVGKVRADIARKKDPTELKKALPSVSLSGVVTSGGRGAAMVEGRFDHNGLLQVDIDGKDNPGIDPEEVRDSLVNDPHIVCAFLSPSGNGVKAVMLIPACETPAEHLAAFNAMQRRMRDTYGLKIDDSTKDPVRLFFVSWDADAKWNDEAVPLVIPDLDEKNEDPPADKPSTSTGLKLSERFGSGADDWTIEDLDEMLARVPAPPKGQYQVWIDAISGAWNTLGEAATSSLMRHWPEWEQGEYAKRFSKRETNPTILKIYSMAKAYGWKPSPRQQALAARGLDKKPEGERKESAETHPFASHHHRTITGPRECLDFVEDTLTDGGSSVWYGQSNTGKSFLLLALGASVATGRRFRDEMETEQGAVVYVALEGETGMRNRIDAMHREGLLPDVAPFFLIFDPVNLLTEGHAARLAESVKAAASQSDMPCKLVILDTMSRAMAGGDENKPADMTAAVAAIDAVRAATGAHVAVVHHSGKDEARGSRGHSSLRAAVDTEVEIVRPEGQSVSTARITKQRDLPFGPPMPYTLRVVELGTNRRGKPITSCVVHHEDEIMAALPEKKGRGRTYSAEQLLDHLPSENVTKWQKATCEETGMSRALFYQFKGELESRGSFHKTQKGIQKT